MDLQEEHQPKLTEQVAKVKVRTRPWRAIIALGLAIAAAGVSWAFGHKMKNLFEPGHLTDSIVAASAAVVFLVFATIAVAAFASQRKRESGIHPFGALFHCLSRQDAFVIFAQNGVDTSAKPRKQPYRVDPDSHEQNDDW